MRNILKWASLVALFVFTSCIQVNEIGETPILNEVGVHGYFTPVVEEDSSVPDTKASVSTSDWKYLWEEGDRINIWSSAGNLLIYTVTKVVGDHATFSGSGFTLTSGATYYSSHPLIRSVRDDFHHLTTTYEDQVQTANNDAKHIAEYMYTYSYANCTSEGSASFRYRHLSSFIRFIITLPKAMTPTELSITGDDANFFALDGYVDLPDSTFTRGKQSNTMTLKLENIQITESDKVLKAFLAVSPCAAGTYVIRIKDSEGTVYTSPEISKNVLAAGKAIRFETEVYEGMNPAVAIIGDTVYPSLAAAVAAVPADGTETTITMVGDDHIVGNNGVTIDKNKNIILDLNGKTISQTGPMSGTSYLIKNLGTLTIKDSSDTEKNGGGNGKMLCSAEDPDTGSIPSYATNLVSNYGALNIESGYFQELTNAGYASFVVDNYNGGTASISGGKLCNTAEYAYVIRMFLNSTSADNVLNISGTAIIEGSYAVWMQFANDNANKGSLNITGGTLNATDGYAMYAGSAGGHKRIATNVTVSISDGTINGNGAWFGADAAYNSISVTGGHFANFGVSAVGGSKFVTGGEYESVDKFFADDRLRENTIVADGYKVVFDNDLYYVVPSSDPREEVDIFPTNRVYYYWLNNDGTRDGGLYDFYAPFDGSSDAVLMDGEFIELQGDINMTKDVTYTETCGWGDPIYVGGTFGLTFGDFVINTNGYAFPIPVGVNVKTDKQTSVFSAAMDGYAVVETPLSEEDFHYLYSVAPYVAQIGETKYTSLAEAIAAVPSDGTATTITMIGNESVTVSGYAITIASGKNVVLDLNGKTVTGVCSDPETSALIRNLGTLTICDSGTDGKLIGGADATWTWDGTDDYTGSYASNLIRNEGTLVVNGGTLYNASTGSAAYAIDNYSSGQVTVNGGYIDAKKASAIRLFYNNGGQITVTGGTIGRYNSDDDCCYMGIQVQNGTNAVVNISGGTISGSYALYSSGSGSSAVSISGGSFDGYVGLGSSLTNASVSGGMFKSWVGSWSTTLPGFITGGVFADAPSDYVADGYIVTANTDPDSKVDYPYTVVEGVYVAKIGDVEYETLEAAFAAANDGDTITLLADCAGNGIIAPQDKFASSGLTVDLNGHSYTVDGNLVGSTGTETQAFQLLMGNKITFKNGAITSDKAKFLIQNYSDLTLQNMSLSLNNTSYSSAYTLSNNNGTIVIDGSTINANSGGGFAFDVCRYASYPSVNVTVKGASVINGNVEVSASGSDPKDGICLTASAGTFNGNLVLDASAANVITSTPAKCVIKKADAVSLAAPAGFVWTSNGDGTSTLKVAVASVNGVQYGTLESAFAAATDGQTITLLADCAGNGIQAPQGKFTNGVTVDFNGHTYTMDGNMVGSTGTQTQAFQLLKDNKITFKNGTITSQKALFLIQNYSDLTLEGMTLTLNNPNYSSAYTLSNNNGNVVIDGTTINANPAGGFAFDVCRYDSYPSVNVTVKSNSTINGNVEVSASNNDAKDGFSLMLETAIVGNIVLDATAAAAIAATPNKAVISKSSSVNQAAPANFKWVNNGTTSTLAPIYVTQIGGTKYETLEAAFAAVTDGQTITLLASCAGNGIQAPQGKFTNGVTVDFNGFTYTMDGNMVGSTGTQTQAFQLLKDNKITFKNGTITSAKALMLIQNYSDLTLQGMTLNLTTTGSNLYTLSNNNGNVTIDGTTINAANANSFAFDVCRYSSYPSVNVTVTGASVINGKVEVSSESDPKNGFGLTVSGGTFNGNLVLEQNAANIIMATPEKGVITKADAVTLAAPDGFQWVSNGNGTSTLKSTANVGSTSNYSQETVQNVF